DQGRPGGADALPGGAFSAIARKAGFRHGATDLDAGAGVLWWLPGDGRRESVSGAASAAGAVSGRAQRRGVHGAGSQYLGMVLRLGPGLLRPGGADRGLRASWHAAPGAGLVRLPGVRQPSSALDTVSATACLFLVGRSAKMG